MNTTKLKRAIEIFPELNDRDNKWRFVDFIKVDDYKIFCKKCLEATGVEPTEYTNKVAEIVLDLLIRKELLTEVNHQTYVDSLLVAAFLHNIYYGTADTLEYDKYQLGFDKNIANLLKAREEFDKIADEDGYKFGPIPEQFREMIWDTIEGQLGDCTPMAKTKPTPNSPQDLFATAILLTKILFAEKRNSSK